MYSIQNLNTLVVNKVLQMGEFNSNSEMCKHTGTETITFNCLKQFNKFKKIYRKFKMN